MICISIVGRLRNSRVCSMCRLDRYIRSQWKGILGDRWLGGIIVGWGQVSIRLGIKCNWRWFCRFCSFQRDIFGRSMIWWGRILNCRPSSSSCSLVRSEYSWRWYIGVRTQFSWDWQFFHRDIPCSNIYCRRVRRCSSRYRWKDWRYILRNTIRRHHWRICNLNCSFRLSYSIRIRWDSYWCWVGRVRFIYF